MRHLYIILTLGTTLNCLGQEIFEQKALDYFSNTIRPEFSEFMGRQLTFYFKDKSTDKLTWIDFSSTRRPNNQYYKPDFSKLGLDKCDSVDEKTLKSITLKRPIDFIYKRRYVNRHLYVYLWRLSLWKRKEKGRFNVYVDRVVKCGQAFVVNITLYPTIDSYWYNFNIFMDDKGNVTEWYYVNYIS